MKLYGPSRGKPVSQGKVSVPQPLEECSVSCQLFWLDEGGILGHS